MSGADGASANPHGWTTPQEIVEQVNRMWARGRILAARIDGTSLFPVRIQFRRPTRAELADKYEEVQGWIQDLDANCKEVRRSGYTIEYEEVRHKQLGRNQVPRSITIDTESDAIAMLGVVDELERFDRQVQQTQAALPQLIAWMARKPIVALSYEKDWRRIIDVVMWLRTNPRSSLYLRQVDIPSVDSKFVEERKGILSELLEIATAGAWESTASPGAEHFERRYGLRSKPPMVRFRLLDPALFMQGISDLTIPASEFAQLSLDVDRVFVTENEINGLIFPSIERSLVVFGLGHAVSLLGESVLLSQKRLFYWGDIDTHGIAILDRMRGNFPHTQSLLMDRETLLAHREYWVVENDPVRRRLDRLTEDEASLYQDLLGNRLGERVRLEQERVGFGWLRRSLAQQGVALSPF